MNLWSKGLAMVMLPENKNRQCVCRIVHNKPTSFQEVPLSIFQQLMQPSEKQQEAADKFVQMLDLAPTGKKEALQPILTPNHVVEVLWKIIERMKNRIVEHVADNIGLRDYDFPQVTEIHSVIRR